LMRSSSAFMGADYKGRCFTLKREFGAALNSPKAH
jgi:hypothetical protein